MPKFAVLSTSFLLTLPAAALWASARADTPSPCDEIPPPACHGLPTARSPVPSVFSMSDEEAFAFQRETLGNVHVGLMQVREHVAGLSPEERDELRRAARYVVDTCPYTSATVEIVQLMRDTAHQVQAQACAEKNVELMVLTSTLDEHWKLLGDIGATPRAGACGDSALDARFAALDTTLESVEIRVNALDEFARTRLDMNNAVVARHTANLWNSKPSLMDYNLWMGRADAPADACSPLSSVAASFARVMKRYMALFGC